jgi:hypothetical protein
MPLATGKRVANFDNADAGGANPALPAAPPFFARGTGVHTGFSTTNVLRTTSRNSVARSPEKNLGAIARRAGDWHR